VRVLVYRPLPLKSFLMRIWLRNVPIAPISKRFLNNAYYQKFTTLKYNLVGFIIRLSFLTNSINFKILEYRLIGRIVRQVKVHHVIGLTRYPTGVDFNERSCAVTCPNRHVIGVERSGRNVTRINDRKATNPTRSVPIVRQVQTARGVNPYVTDFERCWCRCSWSFSRCSIAYNNKRRCAQSSYKNPLETWSALPKQ
jgi:hypothetical protein